MADHSAITKMERGVNVAAFVKISELAEALDCHPGDLFDPPPVAETLSPDEQAMLLEVRQLNEDSRRVLFQVIDGAVRGLKQQQAGQDPFPQQKQKVG